VDLQSVFPARFRLYVINNNNNNNGIIYTLELNIT